MAKVDVRCPFCEQTESVKKHGLGKARYQRCRCQMCCRTFQLDYVYCVCQSGMKEQIVDLAMNISGIRDTVHISINAAVRMLKHARRDV